MKQSLIIFAAFLAICNYVSSQPRYDYSKLKTEKLDRGVVAVRQDDGHVVVSWRTLISDSPNTPFDVYRDGKRLNKKPLTEDGTFYIDDLPTGTSASYEVRGGGINGQFSVAADAPEGYLPVTIEKPEGGKTPDGRPYFYSANDASVADVDGDGQYEILLKWDPSNSRDNAHDGFSGPTFFDCYKLDGKRLWRINLGNNIRSGAHYVPFIFFDIDGDGKAELIVRTSDGTIDGKGNVIGDPNVDYRYGVVQALANPVDSATLQREREWMESFMRQRQGGSMGRGNTPDSFPGRSPRPEMNRRNGPRPQMNANIPPMAGRILNGIDYITVFNGLTGEAMDTKPYIPERGNPADWGDERANRSDRFLAAVGYLDGEKASAIFCRGYYTRTVLAAWDWDGKELKTKWVFDTDQPDWKEYAGQGNHNLRVADVDGDGCDEITYGAMAVDHDGTGLYNTGMGHGDAIHLMAFDPSTDELQVWDCHENKRDGSDFRDARTGKVIFQILSNFDVGRAMAADIDPTNRGVEMWSSDSRGIHNIKGDAVTGGDRNTNDNTALFMDNLRLPVNFGIWWDGDLLRELLDRETVFKYNWIDKRCEVLKHLEGCSFNNGSKSNPCLSADILGDWREEVIARDRESTELRIYITTIPTQYRMNSLMQDIPYRLSVATENVGYNQPPEPGFYLGPDKTDFLK